jgi:hypothetical protein
MTQPYTYLIGWPDHNKWYYGVRYADNCHPSDLWNPYKTSSKAVQAYISLYGDPSIKQIRRVFSCKELARIWENKVLKKLNVVFDNKWLNKTNNKSIAPLYGEDHPNFKRRGKDSPLFEKNRPPHIAKIKRQEWLKNNPMDNEVSKEKSILKRSGDNHHMKQDNVKEKVSGKNNWIYKNPSALKERRQQFIDMNKARTGMKYEKVPCPHCNTDMPKNNFKRHMSLCKNRNIS